jgi:uncharacterized membrane protein
LRSRVTARADLALALITVAAGALRVATLSQSVWFDEAGTVREVAGSFGTAVHDTLNYDVTPPLYVLLLWCWRHLFGSSAADLRTLSALAGTLAIPIAFAAVDRLAGRRAGLIAAALVAVNPVLLYFSQEIRAYAVIVCVSGLAFVAFLDVLERGEVRSLVVWAACSVALLWLHYYDVLFVAPQAAWLASLWWRQRRLALAIAVGAVVLAGAPLLLVIHHQQPHAASYVDAQLSGLYQPFRYSTSLATANVSFMSIMSELMIGPGGPLKRPLAYAAMAAIVGALVVGTRVDKGAVRIAIEKCGLLVVPGAAVMLAFLASRAVPLQGRYMLSLWLPASAAVAIGFSLIRPRLLGLGLASGLGALWLVVGVLAYADPVVAGREDVRSAARVLGAAGHGRLIAVSQQWDLLGILLYRPAASRFNGRTVRVRELDVVALPDSAFPYGNSHHRPPLPALVDLPARFRRAGAVRGDVFWVVRYVAAVPVLIDISPAAGVFGPSWRFLYEPAGGRIGSL